MKEKKSTSGFIKTKELILVIHNSDFGGKRLKIDESGNENSG